MIVVSAWMGSLLLLGLITSVVGVDFRSDLTLPDVESRRGLEVLEDDFGGLGAGIEGSIVFHSETGFSNPAVVAELEGYLQSLTENPDHEITVDSPFVEDNDIASSEDYVAWLATGFDAASDSFRESLLSQSGNGQLASLNGSGGEVALAKVEVHDDEIEMESLADLGAEIRDNMPQVAGVQIEFGGGIFEEFTAPNAELLGLAFAIVVLILSFGSVLAMGLPIGVALGGISVGAVLIGLLSQVASIPELGMTIGIMIGLGVGIDYALFIVTRYREELARGHNLETAVARAIDTSGRAVIFAGLTVVISLLGMLLMGVGMIGGLGIAAAVVVTVTMIASVTLLPALISFVGERINVTRWRGLVAAGCVSLALITVALGMDQLFTAIALMGVVLALVVGSFIPMLKLQVKHKAPKPLTESFPYRWSRVVQNHPWAMTIGAAVLLLIMAIPLGSIRLGFSDAGNAPEDSSARKAYDLIAEGFGPGQNGPLLLVADINENFSLNTSTELLAISSALHEHENIASISPPIVNNMDSPEESSAVLWQIIPAHSPQDAATTDLVSSLREDKLPQLVPESLEVLVTGEVAVLVDFSNFLSGRMFMFFGAVLSISFLLLMMVFRSILVPIKAVIMNLLSIGAAYGAVVAIFQWGWLGALIGVEPAPIEPFVPMMLFAIVFGLSMDYEVFLLSRIREEWIRSGNSRTSVADGLAATAKVITAAAAIMVVVFGSFILESDRIVKLMGFGLAFAVFLDATVVRMLLVPATMELLGDKNWWFPKWLDRVVPRLNVEGGDYTEAQHDA